MHLAAALVVTLVLVVLAIRVLHARLAQQEERKDGPHPPSDDTRIAVRQRRPVARRRSTLDRERLAAHVRKLHQAVDDGFISQEEAVASIVRQAEGELSTEAARRLLHALGAA